MGGRQALHSLGRRPSYLASTHPPIGRAAQSGADPKPLAPKYISRPSAEALAAAEAHLERHEEPPTAPHLGQLRADDGGPRQAGDSRCGLASRQAGHGGHPQRLQGRPGAEHPGADRGSVRWERGHYVPIGGRRQRLGQWGSQGHCKPLASTGPFPAIWKIPIDLGFDRRAAGPYNVPAPPPAGGHRHSGFRGPQGTWPQ